MVHLFLGRRDGGCQSGGPRLSPSLDVDEPGRNGDERGSAMNGLDGASPIRGTLLKVGDVLAERYRILGLIGRGGMAEVYAANHEILHQKVAIKVLLPAIADSPESRSRFLNEARAAVRIRGEHIVTVLDVGSLPSGSPFMVLEFLEGRDLEMYAKESGPLPITEAVDYVLQALQAIAQAHALGIVHRDIKPSNLFLAEQPDGSRVVKVLGFRYLEVRLHPFGAADGAATATSTILGSPAYMAPEQARNAKSVDVRADVWAIGVARSIGCWPARDPFRR